MKEVNVNLGCGSNIVEGWINIDDYALADNKDFLKGDVRNIPLENNSVDHILLDQVLEHMAMADVPTVLYEVRRVLKKGGTCSILVPDFEGAVNQWLACNHNAAFDPQKYHYFSEVIYGNQNHEGEFHKTPMCAGYLHFLLNMVGLTEHTISFWPAFGEIPVRPGTRPYIPTATLRNAQLVCDIVK